MAIIKCKMCGGDIEISADKTFGTCEYCGSTMTLPKTDDDQRLSLFNRGTHLRRNGEFDKAAAIYEQLIGENDADAEAHWNLLLCRYGIEYVQVPASGERIPTCHRASFDSILNDVDYQAALQYSDGVARSLYEKEAQRIASLQKDILAISQKETPFDVFICYKESDENGKRTKDSALAQDIYYQLTDAGYKVFFARITLEDKLGQEYEPYIFAALHSAKVMVVVGTKPEYLNAVWVKNEWSRYLALMRTDRSRLLIPCYRDMDPYDMPEELSMLQSQDMGKIGFIQDLIRGVKKVVDAAKPQEAVTETVKETVVVHNEGGSNVQALLKRGNMALEDGEWTKADEFFEQVLNQNAECGAAYLGKFLARVEYRSAKTYADAYIENVKAEAPNEKNADACEPDEAFITSCVEKYTVPGILSGNQIRQMLEFDLEYCEASSLYALRAEEAQEEFAADKDLTRAVKYASREAKMITENIPQALDKLRADAQKHEDAEKARITAEYRKFLTETEARLEKEHPQRLKEAQEQKKAAAKTKRTTTIALGAAAAIIAVALLITKVIIPSSNYSKAEKLLAAGDYDSAISMFDDLGEYKAASSLKKDAIYEKAGMLMDAADYDDAIALFDELGDYKEADSLRKDAAYAKAEVLMKAADYTGAIAVFDELGNYKDAVSLKKEAAYTEAKILMESSDYDSAIGLLDELGFYKDASSLKDEAETAIENADAYEKADSLQQCGKIAEAAISFGALGDYADARARSFELWDKIADRSTMDLSSGQTVALRADGTVVAAGNNKYGQCDVSGWTDIVAISSGECHTVGLKSDGTVVATGRNSSGECDISDWTDIVAISVGYSYTVGLKSDGTVVAAGSNTNGQCNVSEWTNIVAIYADIYRTFGLKPDGAVLDVGTDFTRKCDVSGWNRIVDIRDAANSVVGLRTDGTVAVVSSDQETRSEVSRWRDIVEISGWNHIVGLKADGTVVAMGRNSKGECDVSDWTDIVAIRTGTLYTVGLKADGTVVAAGWNEYGQCDVSDWTDIVAISSGNRHTVGLKADGTVVAVGDNEDGQCDVSDWTNIKLPD